MALNGNNNTALTVRVVKRIQWRDYEVAQPPNDTVSCLAFTPILNQNFLLSGSWDNELRCWEVVDSNNAVPKAMQLHQGPVLDIAWSTDGSKVFSASCDKTARMWDLNTNQSIQIGQHESSIKTINCITASNYSCLMTGSWDKTLKFWDGNSPNPILNVDLPERCYCAHVTYPMVVVGLANRMIIIYNLEGGLKEYKRMESPVSYKIRCLLSFIKNNRAGFILGNEAGSIALQYVDTINPEENFTINSHRSEGNQVIDIYPINDLSLHPFANTLASVGADGRYKFWNLDNRCHIKTSQVFEQPLTSCCFNSNGNIFAYSEGYDWSKGHEFYKKQSHIYLHDVGESSLTRIKIA